MVTGFYLICHQMRFLSFFLILGVGACSAQTPPASFDVIIRGGTVYDGSGRPAMKADVGIRKDTIAFIGNLSNAQAPINLDATDKAVAPGFINMLSWADGTILRDGRAMSDLLQGVTLEVFGEGWSPGPRHRGKRDSLWTTLGGYFDHVERLGISPNVASFVGATTVRMYVMNQASRPPTPTELAHMKKLVADAMEQGAMGLGTSLIYAPATFATTEELIELSKVAAAYRGMYITHMRSESDFILQALNETFRIAREADIPAEIYHLKINQARNWNKIDTVLFKIDSARQAGLIITANMYPYAASATGLKERVPMWAQEGGLAKMRTRFRNPALRKKILNDMENGIPTRNSDPKDVMLLGFKKDSLNRLYRGKRLNEVARLHGKSADETVLDLLSADKTSIPAIFFLISEQNIQKMIGQPYVSIGSDAGALALTKNFVDMGTHPRAYGSFARFLARYVREEKLMSWEEAIRRMTSLPASNLKLINRGSLQVGYFADVVVFDSAEIQDYATFEKPHQYSRGVHYVFVNGVMVVNEGEHTGARPGRALRGPGFRSTR